MPSGSGSPPIYFGFYAMFCRAMVRKRRAGMTLEEAIAAANANPGHDTISVPNIVASRSRPPLIGCPVAPFTIPFAGGNVDWFYGVFSSALRSEVSSFLVRSIWQRTNVFSDSKTTITCR